MAGMSMMTMIGLAVYVIGFIFILYACVIADPETSSIARTATETLPNELSKKVGQWIGEKNAKFVLSGISNYMMVILYLVMTLGGWSVMFVYAYPMVNGLNVSFYHKWIGYIVFISCLASWRYAHRVPPGFITDRTMAKFDNYPYDDLLFTRNNICPTIGIRKLPRSKFDRSSKQHVPRFDHFCGWLNQAVGEENYRFFLLFLFVHTSMLLYGATMSYYLLQYEISSNQLMNAIFFDANTGQEVEATRWIVYQYIFTRNFYVGADMVFMSMMGITLLFFLCFHLYIAAFGMTTNEFFKWQSIRKWHTQATKKYKKAVKEGKVSLPTSTTMTTTTPASSSSSSDNNNNNDLVIAEPETVGCVGPSSSSSNDQEQSDKKENEEEEKIMNPGPFPKNIYDLGIYENFKEVIFPRSLRKDAIQNYMESLKKKQQEDGDGSSSNTNVGIGIGGIVEKPKLG